MQLETFKPLRSDVWIKRSVGRTTMGCFGVQKVKYFDIYHNTMRTDEKYVESS
jgi:hypothetical protein